MSFKKIFPALGLILGLAGCVSARSPDPSVTSISIAKVDSAVVRIDSVKLERGNEGLILSGRVVRNSPALDQNPGNSHLLVALQDVRGTTNREIAAEFEPREIPHGHKMPGYATFRVILGAVPPEIARIEVRARDESKSAVGPTSSP